MFENETLTVLCIVLMLLGIIAIISSLMMRTSAQDDFLDELEARIRALEKFAECYRSESSANKASCLPGNG